MRWLVATALITSSVAMADGGGAAWLVKGAHDAAVRGDCATAHDLARRVKNLDAQLYASTVETDAAIAACVVTEPVAPPSTAVVVTPPPPDSVRVRVEPVSGGRIAGQSFISPFTSLSGAALALVPMQLCEEKRCGDGALFWALIGAGMGVGAGAGVSLGGLGDDGHASFLATFGGGLAGGLVAGAVGSGSDAGGFALAAIFLPTIGALSGYYISRDAADSRPMLPAPALASAPSLAPGTNAAIMPLGSFEF